MVAIENILLAAVSVFALALTVIAAIAMRRTGDVQLGFLVSAFAVFFVKGLVLTILLFIGSIDLRPLFLVSGSLDLVILALFYGFTLRR